MSSISTQRPLEYTPGARAHRRPALLTGLLAGVVVAVLAACFLPLGVRALPFVPLGMMAGMSSSTPIETSALGLFIFFALSAVAGVAYARAFRRIDRAGPLTGTALGTVHACIVALALATGMALHPELPSAGTTEWPAGFSWLGLLVVSGLHVVFGLVVGFIEGRVDRRPRRLPARPHVVSTPPTRLH